MRVGSVRWRVRASAALARYAPRSLSRAPAVAARSSAAGRWLSGDRLLGIVEGRCLTGRNGATWQIETVRRLDEDDHLDRYEALRAMLQRYMPNMHSNVPVHEWPVD